LLVRIANIQNRKSKNKFLDGRMAISSLLAILNDQRMAA